MTQENQQIQAAPVVLASSAELQSNAMAAAARASIEMRAFLAAKNPRDWDTVRTRLMKECKRSGFAESAIYRKPVGKKQDENGNWVQNHVEGLSVRFAEAALRHLGNFYSSAVSIFDDTEKTIVRVTVMDLESNATLESDVQVTKSVERKATKKGDIILGQRTNSYGEKIFVIAATADDVLNKTNALVSKALRNAILRLLPGDIQDECEAECRRVMSANDKADPEAAKKKLFDAFGGIGVEPHELKEFLGHSNNLSPAELSELRAIFTAIIQGDTSWQAILESRNVAEGEKPNEAQKKTIDIVSQYRAEQKAKKEEKEKPKPTTVETTGTPAEAAQGS